MHNRYRQRGGEDAVFEAEAELLRTKVKTATYIVNNGDFAPLIGPVLAAWRLPWSKKTYRAFQRLLASEKPDVAHFHNIFPQITVSAFDACREAGVPVVHTLHNFRPWCSSATFFRAGQVCEECTTHGHSRAKKYACYRGSRLATAAVVRMQQKHGRDEVWATKVDRFIALTRFARDKAISLGIPAERVVVKPNFVARSNPLLDCPRGPALLLGRLSPEKGVRVAIEAFRKLPHARLDIAGSGPDEVQLRRIAPPNVRFLGAIAPSDVGALVARCSFLVLPSVWYEMFPRVVVEAMASGVPVLASRIGGLPELVLDGITGLLFTASDSADLAEKASLLLENTDLRDRMAAASRSRYDVEFTPEVNLRKLLAIYSGVLRTSGSGRPFVHQSASIAISETQDKP